jgi:hypothetical protein
MVLSNERESSVCVYLFDRKTVVHIKKLITINGSGDQGIQLVPRIRSRKSTKHRKKVRKS